MPPTHSDNGSIQHVAKINPAPNTDNNIIAPTTTKRGALLANQTGNGLDPIKTPIGQNAFTTNIDKGDLGNGDVSIVMASLNSNSEENNNRLFILDEEDVNRSKAGTFFKRLKRTVARTARVKPGNSLKIAGFEFAVK
jgi:hypothetical protein